MKGLEKNKKMARGRALSVGPCSGLKSIFETLPPNTPLQRACITNPSHVLCLLHLLLRTGLEPA